MSNKPTFNLKSGAIGDWEVSRLELNDSHLRLGIVIQGTIGNSIPTSQSGKATLENWKIQIASVVKAQRGHDAWDSSRNFAITLALRFCPALHGYQNLDVENFIKPIIDALAAGLFCNPEIEPSTIPRFDFDDSNFNTLLIQRLPDVSRREDEGVAIFVSAR